MPRLAYFLLTLFTYSPPHSATYSATHPIHSFPIHPAAHLLLTFPLTLLLISSSLIFSPLCYSFPPNFPPHSAAYFSYSPTLLLISYPLISHSLPPVHARTQFPPVTWILKPHLQFVKHFCQKIIFFLSKRCIFREERAETLAQKRLASFGIARF
jgi:hypothetical protein